MGIQGKDRREEWSFSFSHWGIDNRLKGGIPVETEHVRLSMSTRGNGRRKTLSTWKDGLGGNEQSLEPGTRTDHDRPAKHKARTRGAWWGGVKRGFQPTPTKTSTSDPGRRSKFEHHLKFIGHEGGLGEGWGTSIGGKKGVRESCQRHQEKTALTNAGGN